MRHLSHIMEGGDKVGRMPDTATYTHGHAESVLRSHRTRTAENSAAYLLPHLRAGLSLLDIGSGPGTITADPAERGGAGGGPGGAGAPRVHVGPAGHGRHPCPAVSAGVIRRGPRPPGAAARSR